MPDPLFIDRPSTSQPSNVSSAYYDIAQYVKETYQDLPLKTQELIFCIAYTEYAREKKRYVQEHVSKKWANPHVMDDVLKESHTHLCHQNKYKEFCDDALDHINAISKSVSMEMIQEGSSIIVEETSSRIRDEMKGDIDALSQKLGNISDALKYRAVEKRTVKHFVKATFFHAVEIVLAAVMVLGVAYVLSKVAPFLSGVAVKYLGPILELFNLQVAS